MDGKDVLADKADYWCKAAGEYHCGVDIRHGKDCHVANATYKW